MRQRYGTVQKGQHRARAEHDRNRGRERRAGQRIVEIGQGRTPHKFEKGGTPGEDRGGRQDEGGKEGNDTTKATDREEQGNKKEKNSKKGTKEGGKQEKRKKGRKRYRRVHP